jgi:23S rRNA (pseudouridine1915-N3)-methyltransferase
MRLSIAAVGRLKDGPERTLYLKYADRVDEAGRALALGPLTLIEIAEGRASSTAQRRADEASRLLAAASKSELIVMLDGSGKSMSSEGFAAWLAKLRDGGTRSAAFLIGGPDGHGESVSGAAGLKLSLGAMTLPHGLARIVLAEQIYRAVSILGGHPYHRG